MSRTIVFFDLETTGSDPEEARIVEMTLKRFEDFPSDFFPSLEIVGQLVDPPIPIPEEATEIHGISDEDVEPPEVPSFPEVADEVQRIVRGATLVTFSGRTFDVPILHRELRLADREGLETDERGSVVQPEIDLHEVWKNVERRNLESAARRFAGEELGEDAHSSAADTAVLRPILYGMCDRLELWQTEDSGTLDDEATLDELEALTTPDDAVDRFGYFVRREEDGAILFNFSQNEGEPVSENPGMVRWMLERDFPTPVLEIAKREVAS